MSPPKFRYWGPITCSISECDCAILWTWFLVPTQPSDIAGKGPGRQQGPDPDSGSLCLSHCLWPLFPSLRGREGLSHQHSQSITAAELTGQAKSSIWLRAGLPRPSKQSPAGVCDGGRPPGECHLRGAKSPMAYKYECTHGHSLFQ